MDVDLPDDCVLTGGGDWGAGETYDRCEAVKYTDGAYYLCIQQHDSSEENAPPDQTNWVVLALKGDDGTGNSLSSADGSVSEALYVDNGGNVGIGTTAPGAALDVVGRISQTGLGNSTFLGEDAGKNDDGSNNNNTAVGKYALKANVSGFNNTAIGNLALANNAGDHNTALGSSALNSNTTGALNTALGESSLFSNTSGQSNTATGRYSLFFNETGSSNTADGVSSLFSNSTGSENTAAGFYALAFNSSGGRNTALGYHAGSYQSDGWSLLNDPENSIYIGNMAKGKDNDDNNSIVIGYNAVGLGANTVVLGNTNTTLTSLRGNVGVGTDEPSEKLDVSGNINASGTVSANAFTGDGSGLTNTYNPILGSSEAAADNSIFVDHRGYTGIGTVNPGAKLDVAGRISQTGLGFSTYVGASVGENDDGTDNYNTGIGDMAMRYNTSGNRNVAVGSGSLGSNNTGSYNTAIGTGAFWQNTTGNKNVAIGHNAGISTNYEYLSGAEQSIYIGFQARGRNPGESNSIVIGGEAVGLGSNTVVLGNSETDLTSLRGNVGVGTDEPSEMLDVAGNIKAAGDLYAGADIHADGDINAGANIHATGSITSSGMNIGSDNTQLGHQALFKNGEGATLDSESVENTAVGSKSLYANTTGSQNTAVGMETLTANTTGAGNTSTGAYSLESNTEGDRNTGLGAFALTSNTTAEDNTSVGYKSAYHLNGSYNAALGSLSLYSTSSGTYNSAFGYSSLFLNETGDENTAIGYKALYKNAAGNENTAIGSRAGYEALGSGNVFIGRYAGYNETGSDKLYIDNSDTATPLIYGDFSTNRVAVFGSLGVNTNDPDEELDVRGDVKVSSDVEVGHDVEIGHNVEVGNDVVTAGEYRYAAPKTHVLKIPAASFSLSTNQDADKMSFDVRGVWHINNDDGNGSYNIQAGFNLPDGAVVTRFSIYYGGADESITVSLIERELMDNNSTKMGEIAVAPTAYSWCSKYDDETISSPTIDNSSYFYFITAEFRGHGDLDFGYLHGAEIEYTLDYVAR
ncbi:beta strand repeat-containing protein [Desulfatibacillum aliphaticivorans]|uniref:beta strand repeat-containing protein n=1 Tax=Desulfatibacillum aliphaticivorans TaxID=218208 RepID=UPI00143BA374|nr:hypothetical protein [Desulfatibacillum aliphaticivorans]